MKRKRNPIDAYKHAASDYLLDTKARPLTVPDVKRMRLQERNLLTFKAMLKYLRVIKQ